MFGSNDVTFNYPDKSPALTILNIDAPAGSVIGLLGGTGSGKSTDHSAAHARL